MQTKSKSLLSKKNPKAPGKSNFAVEYLMHDSKHHSSRVYHSDIMLPLRHQRLQHVFTKKSVYGDSEQLSFSKKLITKLSRASEPSKQFLISVWRQQDFWVQLRWKQIEGSRKNIIHNVAQMKKRQIYTWKCKTYTIEEEKQWNNRPLSLRTGGY